ncbi:MAG: DHH family phosphoesterase [Patescibacteria group bacterium]
MTEKIIVTSYDGPDLDGTASAIAYSDFLCQNDKPAMPILTGKPHPEVKYLLNYLKIEFPTGKIGSKSQLVLVDTSDLPGLSKDINPDNVIEIIDHRKVTDETSFKNAKRQIEPVGAAATLIAERFYNNKIELSKNSAFLLYGGIVSNTLNFKSNTTTDRDIVMADWLSKIAEAPKDIADTMLQTKTKEILANLEESLVDDMKIQEFGGLKIGILQLEITGSNILLGKLQEISITLTEIKNQFELDEIFLTTIDLSDNLNLFISTEKETSQMLESVLNIKFRDNYAIRQGIIMRKEIIPLIKEYYGSRS